MGKALQSRDNRNASSLVGGQLLSIQRLLENLAIAFPVESTCVGWRLYQLKSLLECQGGQFRQLGRRNKEAFDSGLIAPEQVKAQFSFRDIAGSSTISVVPPPLNKYLLKAAMGFPFGTAAGLIEGDNFDDDLLRPHQCLTPCDVETARGAPILTVKTLLRRWLTS